MANALDAQIDAIYLEFDSLLSAGKFGEVDTLLKNIDVARTPDALLLAYLTITLSAAEQLPYRATMYAAAQSAMRERNSADLLAGLER